MHRVRIQSSLTGVLLLIASAHAAPSWSVPTLSGSPTGPGNDVNTMIVEPPAPGHRPRLVLGGAFTTIDGSSIQSPYFAAWDGQAWQPGPALANEVLHLAIHPFEGAPTLFAAGFSDLVLPAPVSANVSLARLQSGSWSGINVPGAGYIAGLASFTLPGHEPALALSSPFFPPFSYIAGMGPLTNGGGLSTTSLQQLGEGLVTVTNAFCVFDPGTPGSSPRLFAGVGCVNESTITALAEFDGSSWINTPGGPGYSINAMLVFDDGSGPALFIAGGFFHVNGNLACSRIAKYQHGVFTPLATGLNGEVYALAIHNDGTGPALFAAGQFTSAGNVPANRIAKWQGNAWHPLAAGLGTGTGVTGGVVRSLASFDDDADGPMPPALYAAGTFTTADGRPAKRFARWGESFCPVDLDDGSNTGTRDLAVDVNDLLYFLVQFEQGTAPADLDNDGDPAIAAPDGAVDINDLLFFLVHFEAGC